MTPAVGEKIEFLRSTTIGYHSLEQSLGFGAIGTVVKGGKHERGHEFTVDFTPDERGWFFLGYEEGVTWRRVTGGRLAQAAPEAAASEVTEEMVEAAYEAFRSAVNSVGASGSWRDGIRAALEAALAARS